MSRALDKPVERQPYLLFPRKDRRNSLARPGGVCSSMVSWKMGLEGDRVNQSSIETIEHSLNGQRRAE